MKTFWYCECELPGNRTRDFSNPLRNFEPTTLPRRSPFQKVSFTMIINTGQFDDDVCAQSEFVFLLHVNSIYFFVIKLLGFSYMFLKLIKVNTVTGFLFIYNVLVYVAMKTELVFWIQRTKYLKIKTYTWSILPKLMPLPSST